MRRALAGVLLVLPLAFAAGAAAKGPTVVRVCGPSGCARLAGEPELLLSLAGMGPELRTTVAPPPQAFYRLTFESGYFAGSGSGFLVPRARALRTRGRWFVAPAADAAQLRSAVARVRPFPRPVVTSALVDGRPAQDPGRYLDLYGRRPKAELPANASGWVPIELRSRLPSPWTGPGHDLEYLPSERLLFRDGDWVKASPAAVGLIERDAGLAAGNGSSTWWTIAAAIGAAGLAVLLLAVRRSRGGRRAPATA
jgi:hypothetical protein